jgi:hypothetical protein
VNQNQSIQMLVQLASQAIVVAALWIGAVFLKRAWILWVLALVESIGLGLFLLSYSSEGSDQVAQVEHLVASVQSVLGPIGALLYVTLVFYFVRFARRG